MKLKNILTKAGSLTLAALMFVSLVPATSFAADVDDTTRVVVVAEDNAAKKEIENNDAIISSFDDVYLLEFDSAKEAKAAVKELQDVVDIVEIDEEFSVATDDEAVTESFEETSIAEETTVETTSSEETTAIEETSSKETEATETSTTEAATEQTTQENVTTEPETTAEIATIPAEEKSDDPLTELEDLIADGTNGRYDIAIIDTGAIEGGVVKSAVSVIGDEGHDKNGHGTKMISAIAEQNSNAKILSIKALGDNGKGNVSAVYAAIEYAKAQNVKVINLSISAKATLESGVIEKAINEAVDAGIIVVGAAGNNGKDASSYVPGNVEKAVVVGAADENGVKLSNSNSGKTVDYNVVAESTSYAAAKMSGFISANGMDKIKDELNQGLIYETWFKATEGNSEVAKETNAQGENDSTNTTETTTLEERMSDDALQDTSFVVQDNVSAGGAIGGAAWKGSGGGVGPGADDRGYAYVWYDNKEHDQGQITLPELDAGVNVKYNSWWLSQLGDMVDALVQQSSPGRTFSGTYLRQKKFLVNGEPMATVDGLQTLLNLSCRDAIMRAAPEQRDTIKARVIGIGIEFQTSYYDNGTYRWGIWPASDDDLTDNTFYMLFNGGTNSERKPTGDELSANMTGRDKQAYIDNWNSEIDATKYNDVQSGESFKDYVYRLNKKMGDSYDSKYYVVHVIAVTEDYPPTEKYDPIGILLQKEADENETGTCSDK